MDEKIRNTLAEENIPQHITDEKTGISYTLVGDYYLPDLEVPEQPEMNLGMYAQMRRDYLRKVHPAVYTNLLTSCKLIPHLSETEQEAIKMEESLVRQMAENEGLTEEMKATDMMQWVRRMNSLRNRAQEIVKAEVIFA